jgi:spermidine synthase
MKQNTARGEPGGQVSAGVRGNSYGAVIFGLFACGAVSVIAQTLLVRELLVVFSGNELTLGIIIANWVALVALGAVLSGKLSDKSANKVELLSAAQVLCGMALVLSVYVARNLKSMAGMMQGEIPGFHMIFYLSLITVLPVALCVGAVITLGITIYSGRSGDAAEASGRGYAFEAAGYVAGGLLFTYFLALRSDSFGTMMGSACLMFLSAGILPNTGLRPLSFLRVFLKILSLALLFAFLFLIAFKFGRRADVITARKQWKGYDLVSRGNSIYGNIAVVRSGEQYTLFSNGIPVINVPEPDAVFTEEFAHFPLLFHGSPDSILLIGGGAGGLLSEILKEPVKRVTYVELDPMIIETVRKLKVYPVEGELGDARVNLTYTDARRFVTVNAREKYDVILLNPGDPSSLEVNRYYTLEFFAALKDRLNEGGIMAFSLPSSLVYLNSEMIRLHRSIIGPLGKIYGRVLAIPGDDACLYICANGNAGTGSPNAPGALRALRADELCSRLSDRKIGTKILNPAYINYRLDARWREWYLGELGAARGKIEDNRDFRPAGVFYSLSYLNTVFSPRIAKVLGVLAKINAGAAAGILIIFGLSALIAVYFRRGRRNGDSLPYSIAVSTTGLAGMGYTVMGALSFQVFYGYLYYRLGLLSAMFMGGLASGAILSTGRAGKRPKSFLLVLEAAMVAFTILFPLLLESGICRRFEMSYFAIIFFAGALTGAEFPAAGRMYFSIKGRKGNAIGTLYAMDLAGACVGAIIVSVWLLPLYGLANSCMLIVFLKVFSICAILLSRPSI